MKCYMDAQSGTEKDAVAVCHGCGMGLCLDHTVESKPPHPSGRIPWEGGGHIRLLCPRCAKAPADTT